MPQVVVTRPEGDAAPWLQALQARGWPTLALPLIAIRPVPDRSALRAAWQRLRSTPQTYRAVMFVSGNAVTHFFQGSYEENVPLALLSIEEFAIKTKAWATGPGTVRALREAGVDSSRVDAPALDAGQFDSEALWAVVQHSVLPGDRVLIVRGADADTADVAEAAGPAGVGRDWLTRRLQLAGAVVDGVVSYQRSPPQWDATQIAQARRAAVDGSVWLLSSSEAVLNLQTVLPGQAWAQARAVATHSRIARAARDAGWGVVCESRPVLADVMASIESMA